MNNFENMTREELIYECKKWKEQADWYKDEVEDYKINSIPLSEVEDIIDYGAKTKDLCIIECNDCGRHSISSVYDNKHLYCSVCEEEYCESCITCLGKSTKKGKDFMVCKECNSKDSIFSFSTCHKCGCVYIVEELENDCEMCSPTE